MSDETNKRNDGSTPQENWKQFDWQEGTRSWDPELIVFTQELPEEEPLPVEEPRAAAPVENRTPPKKEKRKRKRPRTNAEALLGALVYVLCVLGISFGLATLGWNWAGDLLALDKPEKTVTFTVSNTDQFGDVAAKLKEEGLIEYQSLFELFAAFTHKADRVAAGTYELNTQMDYSALLSGISSTASNRETATITIPEGYTVKEIFQLLEEAGICSQQELLAAVEQTTFDFDFLKSVSRKGVEGLEGYLFPDTYEFYKNSSGAAVLQRLLSNFGSKFDESMLKRADELGYSRDEILIMASIIEKETTGSDRELISSVIHNRLSDTKHDSIGGKLEMDSTVQYILEERKEKLTEKELNIDSPYNTRRYAGLPVGPICNPGEASIRAALYPEKTDYYYFMLGDDGNDHFFNTADSFNAFKAAQTGNRE